MISSLVVTFVLFVLGTSWARRRTRHSNRPLAIGWLVALPTVALICLWTPVQSIVPYEHRLFHPGDDWGDIYSISAGIVHVALCVLLPLVMWAVGAGLEATRPPRPFGRCGECGYDLHHASSSVCPECGTYVGTRPRT